MRSPYDSDVQILRGEEIERARRYGVFAETCTLEDYDEEYYPVVTWALRHHVRMSHDAEERKRELSLRKRGY